MNTLVRRRFRWYRAWWLMVAAVLGVLAWSASPQLLWLRSRPLWALVCVAGAVVVAATAFFPNEHMFRLTTSTCTTFWLFRGVAILFAEEFHWRSRIAGSVISTLVGFACMLLGLVTLSLLPVLRDGDE